MVSSRGLRRVVGLKERGIDRLEGVLIRRWRGRLLVGRRGRRDDGETRIAKRNRDRRSGGPRGGGHLFLVFALDLHERDRGRRIAKAAVLLFFVVKKLDVTVVGSRGAVVMMVIVAIGAVIAVSMIVFQVLLGVRVILELLLSGLKFIELIIDGVLIIRERSLSLASAALALAVTALVAATTANTALAGALLIAGHVRALAEDTGSSNSLSLLGDLILAL
jgi:hypothetical protein